MWTANESACICRASSRCCCSTGPSAEATTRVAADGATRGTLPRRSANHVVERRQEALVLAARPVGDPDEPLRAQRLAAPHNHAVPGQALHHLVLVAVPERDPREVGLRLGAAEAAVLPLRLPVHALDHGPLDAALELVDVPQRLDRA